MAVNGPNEWSELREWLAGHLARPFDPTGLTEHDRLRLTRSAAALGTALDDSLPAVEAVRAQLDLGGSPRADDLLRTHLAAALAARTAEVRDVAPDGRLVVTGARQEAECRALADEIVALGPNPELTGFATDLRQRSAAARRWRWVEPDVVTAAAVGLAVLVLPFVGGAIGDRVVTAAGVLVGGALVFGFVLTHRKRQWSVDADTARRH